MVVYQNGQISGMVIASMVSRWWSCVVGQHCWFLMVLGQHRAIMPLSMYLKKRVRSKPDLSHIEFYQELFSHSAYVKFFCDICDKSAVFNILQQNETIFLKEMDWDGGNKEKMRKCREWISLYFLVLSPFSHPLSISSPFPHSLSISSTWLSLFGGKVLFGVIINIWEHDYWQHI